ncbi:MAG: hypothetical protein ABFS02_05570 [Pseudomonadota bacterium]
MSLDSKTRHRLQQEAKRLSATSARLLIEDNDTEEAKNAMERAELARTILSATKQSSGRLYFSAAIGFICLMLAGLAWSVRVPVTEVVLEIEAESLALRLTHDWSADIEVAAHTIHLNNTDRIIAPGLGLDVAPVEMEASGQGLTLETIDLPAGTSLELERQGNALTLYVHDGALSGRIEIVRAELRLKPAGETTQRTISIAADIPETVMFSSIRSTADPVKLVVDAAGPWRLSGLQAGAIRACKEDPPGSGRCVSTLHTGTVKLLATGRTVQLTDGDQLFAGGIHSTRLEIASHENGLKILFQGTVDEIKAGPAGFEQDLSPTWLEYLYHQEQLAFFWSVVVFLWGLLWSLRNFW